jgi:molecular chaperone DnaK
VDARNMGDQLIYHTEKSIKEVGDKLDDSTKADIDRAIENLKKAMEGDNTEEIKRLSDELTQASHKLAETMYAKASQQAQGAGGGTESRAEASKDEDVVDADFEEVKK